MATGTFKKQAEADRLFMDTVSAVTGQDYGGIPAGDIRYNTPVFAEAIDAHMGRFL